MIDVNPLAHRFYLTEVERNARAWRPAADPRWSAWLACALILFDLAALSLLT